MVITISKMNNPEYIRDRLNYEDLIRMYKAAAGDIIPFGSCDWIVVRTERQEIRLLSKHILSPMIFYSNNENHPNIPEVKQQINNFYQSYERYFKNSSEDVIFNSFDFSRSESSLLLSQNLTWQLIPSKLAKEEPLFYTLSLPTQSDLFYLKRLQKEKGITNYIPATYEDYYFERYIQVVNNTDLAERVEKYLDENSTYVDTYWYISPVKLPYTDREGITICSFITQDGGLAIDTINDLSIRGFRLAISINRYKLKAMIDSYV